MFADAERDAMKRDLWGLDRWTDWVESGVSREVRLDRLQQVPDYWRQGVQAWAQRRAARAAGQS
jgi:hypothetical protein